MVLPDSSLSPVSLSLLSLFHTGLLAVFEHANMLPFSREFALAVSSAWKTFFQAHALLSLFSAQCLISEGFLDYLLKYQQLLSLALSLFFLYFIPSPHV